MQIFLNIDENQWINIDATSSAEWMDGWIKRLYALGTIIKKSKKDENVWTAVKPRIKSNGWKMFFFLIPKDLKATFLNIVQYQFRKNLCNISFGFCSIKASSCYCDWIYWGYSPAHWLFSHKYICHHVFTRQTSSYQN